MSGTNTHLKPLAVRKQLLLVESEVNRAQLINECFALKNQMDSLSSRAHAVMESFHSTIDVVHDGIATARAAVDGLHRSKSPLLSTIINGLRIGSSIWEAIRSRFK